MLAGPCREAGEMHSKQQQTCAGGDQKCFSVFPLAEISNGDYKSVAATCSEYLLITASAHLVPVRGSSG